MTNSLNSMLSLLRPMVVEYTNMTPEDDKLFSSFLENLDEKINDKENQTMDFGFGNMFGGMFKPIARGACKMSMNGEIAVRTSTGYKTYNIKKHKLTNSDSFAFDMDGAFWVVPTFKFSGVGLKRDVCGVVIFNPITGESDYYDVSSVPTWVDNVYKADVILEQVNDWGKYKNGFWNSKFGQKNVVATTEGYNYMAMNDDVYLYTGITSLASDESNIGFILTNMRTKETKFYGVPGAEEYSAMASSEGQVQQMGYVSTFPLLINLNNRPTYLMSLKDNAGLVKMYAFVDVVDYQKVVVSDVSLGIREASRAYLSKMGFNDVNLDKLTIKDITIASIKSYSVNGNSVFYIVDTKEKKYSVEIGVNSNKLPFLGVGDTITIGIAKDEDVTKILEIK